MISAGQVSIRRVTNDIGYILKSYSLSPDVDGLRIDYNRYISRLPKFIQVETHFLKKHHVGLVIGDIPLVPFEAAHQLALPSIGLSNFTWYTAYAQFLSEDERQPFYIGLGMKVEVEDFEYLKKLDCSQDYAGNRVFRYSFYRLSKFLNKKILSN